MTSRSTPGNRLWRKNLRDNDGDGEMVTLERRRRLGPATSPRSGTTTTRAPRATRAPDDTFAGPRPNLRARDAGDGRPAARRIRLRCSTSATTRSGSCSCTRSASRSTRRRPTTRSTWRWAGTDKKPAVAGLQPRASGADLYTTNGEQTDFAAADEGALAITPELSEGNDQNGFEFPDSEGEIQHEFNINKDFAVAAAKSATDPDNPVSPVNIKTQPFYTELREGGPAEVVQPDERLHVRALVQRRRPAGAGPGPARPQRNRARRTTSRSTIPSTAARR